ncbi:MAG: hypothetical protein LBS56_01535 [Propionibacteriaceae bacterium]|jgi:hypothetical protein|nr:hypothetical protein [Propionibacteriaceae bacterium]
MPTRLTKPTRWLAALAAAALILPLNACAEDDTGLPSVGGATQGTGAVDLEAVAQAFYNCLSDAGLPVEYGEPIDGRSVMVTFDDEVPAMWVGKGGAIGLTSAVPEAEAQAFFDQIYQVNEDTPTDAAFDSADLEPLLQVDGVDHSETWARCLDSSGYDENAVWDSLYDPAVMTAFNQSIVDASNEWAKCARENGHPNVIDAHMPQSDTENPTALLPASITEDQLRQLLAVCPNFDPAIEEANEKLFEEQGDDFFAMPEGYRSQPSVGFDFPGFDGDYSQDQTSLSSETEATYERLSKLSELLYEAQMEYWEATADDSGVVTIAVGSPAPTVAAADPTETPS